MGNQRMSGLTKRGGIWHIDKQFRGARVCESTGTGDIGQAKEYLAKRVIELREIRLYGTRELRSFRSAATKYLLDLGHRRIALGNGPVGLTFCDLRAAGWWRAMLGRGLTPDPRLIVSGEMTDEMGFRFGREMLAQTPSPMAFI